MATKTKKKSAATGKTKSAAKKVKKKAASLTGEVDYGKLAGQVSDNSGSGSALPWYKMLNGKVRLRVIPYQSEETGEVEVFFRERRHFNVHPSHKVLTCAGPGCPICAVAQECGETLKNKYKATSKFLMNVVDMDGDMTVVPFRAPYSLWNDIMEICKDSENYPNALSLTKGYTFVCSKSGEGFKTEYKATHQSRSKCDFEGTPVDFHKRATSFQDDTDLEIVAAEMITG